MSDRVKDVTITVVFIIILISIFVINVIVKDKEISNSEKRKLASFPTINKENIINGNLSNDFEKYFADQFVGRDKLRNLKSFVSLNIFKQKDNNELFIKDGSIYKMEYKLNENNIQKSADKIEEVYNKYLKGMNVYYSIIPAKNNYLDDDHLKMNYSRVEEIMKNSLVDLKYIDISNSLNLDDYYKTDLHWKQENLSKIVSRLKSGMNLENSNLPEYEVEDRGDFYGTYYGQLGMNLEPDKIYTLTNEEIENCITYNYETQSKGKVYMEPKTSDKYDIYLSGPVSLIKIENPNLKTDKELILFRDSFGSSIAPLLINSYKTITLVDMRYISSKILDRYIDFINQDVLFLYSTLVLNNNVFK